jgi:hypothetical protein
MSERSIDFVMQIIAETFLADDDHRFQFESMPLGAKPFALCAGQSHVICSVAAGVAKNPHGITAAASVSCRLPDGPAIGQDAGHGTI